MVIEENVSLKQHNSFGIIANAAYLSAATCQRELINALDFADSKRIPVCILGEGTNVLFTRDYPGLVVRMAMTGIELDHDNAAVKVAAGENWHCLVETCMSNRLYGLENLALIPGTAGAAPVQNIGAYGVELAAYVDRVDVLDTVTGSQQVIAAADCEFAYRDSVFKQANSLSLLITAVHLQLSRDWQPNTSYGALNNALEGSQPTPQELFDTVCRIRRSKLPDPKQVGNAGSFFKNPMVSEGKLEQLRASYPNIVSFDAGEPGFKKLPAAWLLDQLGWRGRCRGTAAVSGEHALVLINPGQATGEDVYLLAQEMSSNVLDEFGIALQPEVRII